MMIIVTCPLSEPVLGIMRAMRPHRAAKFRGPPNSTAPVTGAQRGQGYDNGANMRGCNRGVQARILQTESRAFLCHVVATA